MKKVLVLSASFDDGHHAPSDLYCVANEATAEVLVSRGIEASRVAVTGFPVPPSFQEQDLPVLAPPTGAQPRRVLYLINSGSRKVGRTLEEILELPDTALTVTTGRDAALEAKLPVQGSVLTTDTVALATGRHPPADRGRSEAGPSHRMTR